MKKEKTYTRQELDGIIKGHIEDNAQILKDNLQGKESQKNKVCIK